MASIMDTIKRATEQSSFRQHLIYLRSIDPNFGAGFYMLPSTDDLPWVECVFTPLDGDVEAAPDTPGAGGTGASLWCRTLPGGAALYLGLLYPDTPDTPDADGAPVHPDLVPSVLLGPSGSGPGGWWPLTEALDGLPPFDPHAEDAMETLENLLNMTEKGRILIALIMDRHVNDAEDAAEE